ncbi:hypothetical protein B0O80DRAFT_261040 [Mortierella sp. GBAus27b]|nr:hypothetical protein B0O80DRAFT_261040 [Mortierella sp. GBAus27b]
MQLIPRYSFNWCRLTKWQGCFTALTNKDMLVYMPPPHAWSWVKARRRNLLGLVYQRSRERGIASRCCCRCCCWRTPVAWSVFPLLAGLFAVLVSSVVCGHSCRGSPEGKSKDQPETIHHQPNQARTLASRLLSWLFSFRACSWFSTATCCPWRAMGKQHDPSCLKLVPRLYSLNAPMKGTRVTIQSGR